MGYEQEEIRQTLAKVSNNISVLDMMLEFEKTIDNTNIYAYQNWDHGELVKGPDITKYWFETTWMYPYKLMPDPDGAVRLESIGCKVFYEKDVYLVPAKVKGPESYSNQEMKKTKNEEHPVWLITIIMPRKFIDESIIDDIEIQNGTDIDTDEISQAYGDDLAGEEDLGLEGGDEMGDMEGDEMGGEEF